MVGQRGEDPTANPILAPPSQCLPGREMHTKNIVRERNRTENLRGEEHGTET